MKYCAVGLLLLGASLRAQAPSVEQIMSHVAENQARAQKTRRVFVYQQRVALRSHRDGGKLTREEIHEYTVTPTESGSVKKLVRFEGKYANNGKLISYNEPGYEYRDLDLDGEIMDDLAEDLTDDDSSRDGIGSDLFPLTADQQEKYTFALKGVEKYKAARVYRIAFRPKPGSQAPWAGEALVETQEFQPVRVTTRLARGIPLAVRTLLGTDVKGLGFSVAYDKFGEGLWFPVSYGGEFQIRALFVYKRTISISLANSNFRRTDVKSTVAFAPDEQ